MTRRAIRPGGVLANKSVPPASNPRRQISMDCLVGHATEVDRRARVRRSRGVRRAAVALLLAILIAPALGAEEHGAASEESTEDLAKKTQNPVADLISVPFQNNLSFGIGPRDATQWVLNVQPVVPFHLTENWNLITRTIMPIIGQGSPAPGVDHVGGLGDINPSFFLSPANAKHLIWGVGPTFTFPTASNRALGSGKWSAGPTAVALLMQGPWVVGALGNNQWSFAGWGETEVNQLLVQPFLNYNFRHGWYLSSAPIMTANWIERARNQWTVPVGGGGGKLWRVGKVGLPVNTQVQAFYNAVTPDNGADWQLRLQLQLLFPK